MHVRGPWEEKNGRKQLEKSGRVDMIKLYCSHVRNIKGKNKNKKQST